MGRTNLFTNSDNSSHKKSKKEGGVKEMKRILKVLLLAIFLVPCLTQTASAYLIDWYLDPDGTVGALPAEQVDETMAISGTTFVMNNLASGTFNEWGTFQSLTHSGGNLWGVSPNFKELTATLVANGILLGTESFQFTSGIMDVYTHNLGIYGSATGIYGADVGTLIGRFNVVGGGGDLAEQYLPDENGQITLIMEANQLTPGYWFDSNMNDLSNWDLQSGGAILTLGFATTNASILNDVEVGDLIVNEYNQFSTLTMPTPPTPPTPGNYKQPPYYFFIENGGQLRLDVVPEPTTILLLGSGLLGLAGIGFRKKKRIA